jgi:hypothetical protein
MEKDLSDLILIDVIQQLAQLPEETQKEVKTCADDLRKTVHFFGPSGLYALSLVWAEVAVKAAKKKAEMDEAAKKPLEGELIQ